MNYPFLHKLNVLLLISNRSAVVGFYDGKCVGCFLLKKTEIDLQNTVHKEAGFG